MAPNVKCRRVLVLALWLIPFVRLSMWVTGKTDPVLIHAILACLRGQVSYMKCCTDLQPLLDFTFIPVTHLFWHGLTFSSASLLPIIVLVSLSLILVGEILSCFKFSSFLRILWYHWEPWSMGWCEGLLALKTAMPFILNSSFPVQVKEVNQGETG